MADRARGMLDYNEGSYPEPSQCDTCKWRHRGNMNTVACEAFPEGISLRTCRSSSRRWILSFNSQ